VTLGCLLSSAMANNRRLSFVSMHIKLNANILLNETFTTIFKTVIDLITGEVGRCVILGKHYLTSFVSCVYVQLEDDLVDLYNDFIACFYL